MAEITYKIEEFIGVLQKKSDGWARELNLVSWNGSAAKYDIREWDPEHKRMTRGITLTASEAHRLVNMLESRV